MSLELIESADAMDRLGSASARYMAALARSGTTAHIANAKSRPLLLHQAGQSLPITVDDGGYGHSYVSSAHSAYVLYAREEIRLIGLQRGRRTAQAGLAVLDRVLRTIAFNRVVHLDNWLLSTNLHGTWDGEGLPDMRELLTARYPRHFLILRSLDPWSSPALLASARSDGWTLLPSRQIWVVDDLERDWLPRHHCAVDRRELRRSGLIVEDPESLSAPDAARIAELYRQLYVDRYSPLNPIFTPRFIAMTAEQGLLHYRVAREAGGRIMAVAGMLARGGITTPPVVGYDTGRPQKEALYRIASLMFGDWALERKLALHASAGAASFKRNRGAHGVIECMAVYTRHLGPIQRLVVRAMAEVLERQVVPMMRREGW